MNGDVSKDRSRQKGRKVSAKVKVLGSIVNLEEDKGKYIVECCLKLFERLDCRDYCRFDWRLDSKGNPKLLEVNPNPGWCWDGHLAKMCKFGGISYTGMLERILQAFQQRISTQAVHVRREEEHISNIMPHGI